jgi:hypothetical protein
MTRHQFLQNQSGAAAEFQDIVELAMVDNVVNDFLVVVIAGRHNQIVVRRHIRVIAHALLDLISRSGLVAGLGYLFINLMLICDAGVQC